MVQEVNYEVQVQQNGRWSIHARFGSHEKDPAIDEGRQLDKLPSVEAIKVIKEFYDTERDIHNEFVIYKSSDAIIARKTKGAGKEKDGGGGEGGASQSGGSDSWLEGGASGDGDDDLGGPESSGGGKKKTTTLTSIFVKLLMVILFNVIIASGAAMMVDGLMGGTRLFGVHFIGNAQSNLLIGAFTLTFLICAVGLAIKVMRGSKLEDPSQRQAVARQSTLLKKAQQTKAKQKAKKKTASPKAPESTQDEIKAKIKEEEKEATTDRLQAELNKDKQPEDEPAEQDEGLEAEPVDEPQDPPADGASTLEEKQKAYMLYFLNGALEGGQADQAKLDNFNKFGVNLYLAGACEIMSQKKDLDADARARILAESVQVMGFKKSHAAAFSDKYEEYLMADARYMQMFQAGRNAMNIYSTDENSAPRLLDNALTEWNKPKPKEEQTGPVTVLFTDIAGSTAMTQSMGDAGAQKVVRIHNRVVREALSAHAGKEVKHTGDGIMASFAKTSDAVNGAIQMQLETMKHNEAEPDLPLQLKIGLNSGEPIAEDNDLFGTVVQLSARIVDKASADQIYVSEIVRGFCAGKSYNFKNLGGFPMKGFGDDITLFEVIWDENQEEKSA